MSCHLLLLHGWGLGAGMWRPLTRALPECTPHLLNLGFFGPSRDEIPQDQPFIAIGHSLGFLWLLNHLQEPIFQRQCQGLVSINGFARFARTPDFPHGVDRRILDRMARRLSVEPIAVLTDFQRQGGMEVPVQIPTNPNVATLHQGLSWLTQWDGRGPLAQFIKPLLAIAAEDDRIVAPEMTRDSFAPTLIEWLPTGGHLLPLTRTQACATLIDRFWRTLP